VFSQPDSARANSAQTNQILDLMFAIKQTDRALRVEGGVAA